MNTSTMAEMREGYSSRRTSRSTPWGQPVGGRPTLRERRSADEARLVAAVAVMTVAMGQGERRIHAID
jgi:hypothetical protein